ncbi:helix-turn-helix transcriptional regulator [Staphylococcus carnosus]|uniref:helix-turn-helix transcriptional regulator n=1 Tax=Staphylococcus carnosus TaxID=1281 RepID=UPI00081A77D8|nr:helix-turn-helix transcriptional regulator [Staphylococcus carnosus]ANZ33911.1 transcriptional regulator [Staphylococcus carnosus]UTB86092.1 transcriptional regulator [Staphylococcus carnosus]
MFSRNLKYLRQKNGLEQVDLAHKLGRKSASSISEWEKGKYTPKMSTLNKLAEIFNVSIDELMNEDLENGTSSEPKTLAAHLEGQDYTQEELDKILEFAEMVRKSRDK